MYRPRNRGNRFKRINIIRTETHNFDISKPDERLIRDPLELNKYFDEKFKYTSNPENKIYKSHDPQFLNIIDSGGLCDYYKSQGILGPTSIVIKKENRPKEEIEKEYEKYLNAYNKRSEELNTIFGEITT